MSLSEEEKDLYEVFAARHVPFILARLITDQLFGYPYDRHIRALVGRANCEVTGEPGDWVLFLGDWNPHGYVIGPWDSWADIFREALALIEAGQTARPLYTRADAGIDPPSPSSLPTARKIPPPRVGWNPIF